MKRKLFIAAWTGWLGMTIAWGQSNFPPTGYLTHEGVQTPMPAGSWVTLCSTISAAPAPVYQWQFNEADLPGQTNSCFTLTNAQPGQSGGYRLIASNAAGSFTSQVAELAFVFSPPTAIIWLSPTANPSIVGNTLFLFVPVEGAPVPNYQWRLNGTNLPGRTNSALVFSSTQTNDSGAYSVVASNALGVVTSAVARITIMEPVPVLAYVSAELGFGSAPSAVPLGIAVTLQSAITIWEPGTLQWRFNGVDLLNATDSYLTLPSFQPEHAGDYDLVLTTASGSYTSPPVTLSGFLAAPRWGYPQVQFGHASAALVGEELNLVASYWGSSASVQWRFNGVNLPGQTNAELDLFAVTPAQAGNYSFTATNLAGATTSAVVTVRVNYQAPSAITPLTNQTVIEGTTTRFQAFSRAGPPAEYFLQRDGVNVAAPRSDEPPDDFYLTPGQYVPTFSLLDTIPADAGQYRIIASNFLGAVTSTVATLTVRRAGMLDRWASRNPLPQPQALLAVSHGSNQFVAVGERGTILTSPDGAGWAVQNRRVDLALRGVAYGNGQFIAVGDGGTILSSTDGTNWNYRSIEAGTYFSAVAYGNGRFVAVGTWFGYDTRLFHSTDGVQWRQSSPGVPYAENCVAYGNGIFVAAGSESIIRSTDGTNWSQVQAVGKEVKSIIWAAGHFVAVGDDGSILVSTNGALWLPRPALTTRRLQSVTHGAGRFVAVGSRGTVLTSADALNWSVASSGTQDRLESVDYSGGQFVAVGENGTIITSSNGTTWAMRNFGTTRDLDGMAAAGDLVVIVGKGGSILTSSNGVDYTAQNTGLTNDLHGVAWGQGRWVAVGEPGVILTSMNAVNWSTNASGTTSSLKHVLWANGQWTAVGTGGTVVRSTNGEDWAASYIPAGYDLNGVAFGNGVFLIAGDGFLGKNGSLHRSTDGMTWTRVGGYDFDPYTNLRGIIFTNGVFMITQNDALLRFTTYGLSFSAAYPGGIGNSIHYRGNLRAATWAHGLWIVVGNEGFISTSPDLVTWTRRASRTFEKFHQIVPFQDRLLVIGNRGTVLQSGRVLTQIGPPAFLPGTGFRLPFKGVMGRTYQVQASTNLLDWSSVAAFTNATEQAEFTDTNAPFFPRRFYRLFEP